MSVESNQELLDLLNSLVKEGKREQETFEYIKALDKYKEAESYMNSCIIKNNVNDDNNYDNDIIKKDKIRVIKAIMEISELSIQCYLKLENLEHCLVELSKFKTLINDFQKLFDNSENLHLNLEYNYYKAKFLVIKKEYHEAMKLLEDNLLYNTTSIINIEYYYELADIYLISDSSNKAINVLTEAFEKLDNNITETSLVSKIMVLKRISGIYMLINNEENALKTLTQAIELLKNVKRNSFNDKKEKEKLSDLEIELHMILGNCYYRLKNYNNAIKNFDFVLETDEDNDEVVLIKAKIYYDLENYDESLIQLNKAISINPYLTEALKLKKKIYELKGDKSEIDKIDKILNKTHFGFFD